MSIWGAIVGGAISALSGRSNNRAAERNAQLEGEWGLRGQNAGANQDRTTLLYEMQLKEWERQNRRREVARGGRNFAQFATVPQGYRNMAPMDTTPTAMPQPLIANFEGK
jgi:hypothetical protein